MPVFNLNDKEDRYEIEYEKRWARNWVLIGLCPGLLFSLFPRNWDGDAMTELCVFTRKEDAEAYAKSCFLKNRRNKLFPFKKRSPLALYTSYKIEEYKPKQLPINPKPLGKT